MSNKKFEVNKKETNRKMLTLISQIRFLVKKKKLKGELKKTYELFANDKYASAIPINKTTYF